MRLSKLVFGATALCSSYAAIKHKGVSDVPYSPDGMELCLVQVVFRHGARTPRRVPSYLRTVQYEESLLDHAPETIIPYKVVSLDGADAFGRRIHQNFEKACKKMGRLNGGCFPGQLTDIGADQMKELGLSLKDRYVNHAKFLSSSFTDRSDEIYTRSTDRMRAILSARSVLAGMFSGEKCDEAFLIHVSHPDFEIMFANYCSCPYFTRLNRWAWDDPEKLPGIKAIRQSIQKAMDIPESEKVHLVEVFDNLVTAQSHGKKPFGLSEHLMQRLEEGAMEIMHSAFVGVESVRKLSIQLAIGAFVDLLMCNIEERTLEKEDSSRPKMQLYSGHETTIIPMLCALGLEERKWPPYGSNVILELFKKPKDTGQDSKYFVRVLYNEEVKQIDGCSDLLCPLEEFQQAVSSVRISLEDYLQLCAKEDHDPVLVKTGLKFVAK